MNVAGTDDPNAAPGVARPVEADFPQYREMMASERSVGMGGPFDERAAWGMFCHDIACWELFGHGALMIDLEQTGACVGQVGINAGPLFPEKELGWLLYPGFEGAGYATEAAGAMRDWAFVSLRLPTLVSYCDPPTTAQSLWQSAWARSLIRSRPGRIRKIWFSGIPGLSLL